MVTEYVRLRPYELARLRQLLVEYPDEAYDYVGDLQLGDEDEEMSARGMDIDKAWAGLQDLLAKAGASVDVIGGGEPITEEVWGYDAPRLLSAEDVRAASRFFDETPFAVLARHFVPAELTDANIEPPVWSEEWALEYLEQNYTKLVELFRAAACDDEPILVWGD